MRQAKRQRESNRPQGGLLGRYLRGTLFMTGSFALLAAFLVVMR
jgi:hypothetical protein